MANQSPSLRIGLLDNSYHSLRRGYEMWSQWKQTDDAWLLKESIIWVHHGIELALKQLLAQTNAFLVFEDVNKAVQSLGDLREKRGMEKAGVLDLFDYDENIISVGFRKLIDRAAVTLSIPELTKKAALRQKLDELTKYRNKVVHFSIELDIASVSTLLSEILDPLLFMLEREVKDDNFIRNRIPEIRKIAQPVKKFSEELRREIVANAIKATEDALPPKGNRRAGIVWQTLGTGLGKTLVDYLIQVRQLPKIRDEHVIVVADRVELAIQIHRLISDALSQKNMVEIIIPRSRTELGQVLESENPKIIVSTVQKLTVDQVERDKEFLIIGYDLRGLSERLPWSFPNATYILFTSVPPISDSMSKLFFGELVGKYDLMQAIEDGIAQPITLENRKVRSVVDYRSLVQDDFDLDLTTSFESKIFTPDYITQLSEDIAGHFASRQKIFLGKGLIVVSNIATGFVLAEAINKIIRFNID